MTASPARRPRHHGALRRRRRARRRRLRRRRGRDHRLVGPNGAGKTTLFGVLSGFSARRQGRVLPRRRRHHPASPQQRARLGLARTFQRLELFSELTVREHLVVAHRVRHAARPLRMVRDLLGLGEPARRPARTRRSTSILALLGLEAVAERAGRAAPARHRPPRRDRPGARHRADASCCSTSRRRGSTCTRPQQLARSAARACAPSGASRSCSSSTTSSSCSSSPTAITVLDFGKVIARGHRRRDPRQRRGAGRLPRARSRPPTSTDPHGATDRERRHRCSRSSDLEVRYGEARAALRRDLQRAAGSVTAVLGANGAGKSSLAAAIAGVRAPRRRHGPDRRRRHHRDVVARRSPGSGVAYVPEERAIFPHLSVLDNLRARCATPCPRAERADAVRAARSRCSRCSRERRRQQAGTLSGGEQQMLSLARVLAAPPSC